MIGGEVALALAPRVLADLARGRRCVTVTGTNGKSTTTRMVRAALAAIPGPSGSAPGRVASNTNGDNMPSGIVTALMATPDAPLAALEVDEMHLPVVVRDVDPGVSLSSLLCKRACARV
jgi:UDP-N-acetylmuramate-alanine ligase